MNISSTGQASSAALLTATHAKQTAPSAKQEEAMESPQERAKEAGKGEKIDTHA